MICIRKGAKPRKLTVDGRAKAAAHVREHDADPAAFATGTRKFQFSEGIYGHRSVQQALAHAQHEKCCYCESKPDRPYAFLHVEHWRPKARIKQKRGVQPVMPGYFWLAYDWDNLLLACHFCNSTNKGDLFPLIDEAARARTSRDDLSAEDPQLLKPDGTDDPSDHIVFHEEVPRGITAKGRVTVAILGLDRTDHVVRLRLLNQLKLARGVVEKYHDDPAPAAVEFVAQARGFIAAATTPQAAFSAMATAYVGSHPLPA